MPLAWMVVLSGGETGDVMIGVLVGSEASGENRLVSGIDASGGSGGGGGYR